MEATAIFLLFFSFPFFRKIDAAELVTISDSRFLTDGDTLVSDTGIFELGYFQTGSDSSGNIYLGIRYKKIPVTTLVWVANRDQPLASASALVLKITDPGTLVLFNNISMVWSSNTTTESRNATAKLSDTGNLVLMDEHKKVVWQSFDYPTEHWLPGMKIGYDYLRGIKWQLSSWESSYNPLVGEFTWGTEIHNYPDDKLKQGSAVKFRVGAWKSERFKGISAVSKNLNFTYNVIVNEEEASIAYNYGNSSTLFRMTLSSSGKLESWGWMEEGKMWQLGLSFPKDVCDTYNICGAYGSCILNMNEQSCVCLDETKFVPRNKKDWDMADWSGGCVRRTPLDCKNGSDAFIRYSNVKLPDTHDSWFNMSLTIQECKARCIKNCTCMAYANADASLEGRGCLLWFGDLIDIRSYPQGNGHNDIYVRMASSELVAESNSIKKGGVKGQIIIPVIILGVLLLGFISSWLWYARKNKNHAEPTDNGHILHLSKSQEETMELPQFSFTTIANATVNFSPHNKLGEGGFGPVYKGMLEEGKQVAIKRLSRNSSQGLDEFKNEVICISKLQHRNLVKLLGCCIHGDEKLLIYEYMTNKSLDLFIFDEKRSLFLDWTKRFNIIKGIARGLVYLLEYPLSFRNDAPRRPFCCNKARSRSFSFPSLFNLSSLSSSTLFFLLLLLTVSKPQSSPLSTPLASPFARFSMYHGNFTPFPTTPYPNRYFSSSGKVTFGASASFLILLNPFLFSSPNSLFTLSTTSTGSRILIPSNKLICLDFSSASALGDDTDSEAEVEAVGYETQYRACETVRA